MCMKHFPGILMINTTNRVAQWYVSDCILDGTKMQRVKSMRSLELYEIVSSCY